MTYYTYIVENCKTHERFCVHGRNKCAVPSGCKLIAVSGSYEK